MSDYDEYEVIDADTKKRLGRFNDLKSARNMAQGSPATATPNTIPTPTPTLG